jgi:hypothetical protein
VDRAAEPIQENTQMQMLRSVAAAAALAAGIASSAAHAQADPAIFTSGTETGTRYNPGVDSTAYENVYIYAPGATQARINSVTVGIRQVGSAATPAPTVDVEVSLAEMTWDGTAFGRGATIATQTVTIPAQTVAVTTPVTVTWGATDPALRPVLNLQTQTNGMNGYGAFWVGVKFRGANAASTANGWRVVNMPTIGRATNNFGLFNASTGVWGGNYWFGTTTGTDGVTVRDNPARFLLTVTGAAINPVAPASDLLYGQSCGDLGWYHAPLDPDGLSNRWVYASAFVPATAGQQFTPRQVNYAIVRNGSVAVPAPPADMELALVKMTWDGTNFGLGEVVATSTLSLTESTTYVTEKISWNFASPASAPKIDLETGSNPGLGGLWVAARFTGVYSNDTTNGWRVGYAPLNGASLNGFGMDDGTGVFVANYFFGNYNNAGAAGEAKPARMVTELFGTVGDAGSACLGDLNLDGVVNGADLGLLLGAWGPCSSSPCTGDLNTDGVVNGADLGLLLGAWGACP